MKRSALAVALTACMVVPGLVSAQGGPGFLFERPKTSIGVRLGYALPTTGGELFEYTQDEFIGLGADTLSTLGFSAPYVGAEIDLRPWSRWELAAGFGWTRRRALTEYRYYIDTDGNPIEQETTFQVVYFTLGTKYALADRGRQVSRLAWVPSRVTPWVGGGVGLSVYEFAQVGDFVDADTFEIFSDSLETDDTGVVVYGHAGVDLSLFRNAVVTAEARYTYSTADVVGSYIGFNDIDLGGLQLLVGFGFQF